MTQAGLHSTDTFEPIPLRELLPWMIFGGLLMLLALYFVGAERGATAIFQGTAIHEVRA